MINVVTHAEDKVRLKRALISTSDKTGLDLLIDGLLGINPNVVIYSTGGTFTRIAEIIGPGYEQNLKQVSEYTGHPEMQGGLVKTLDHKIYLGLLSESYNEAHERDLSATGAERLDLVVVNLYPFEKTVSRADITTEHARGQIDIGGPCMLRAAAKNYLRVAALCEPADYQGFLAILREKNGATTLDDRFLLARKVFTHTAAYDAAIASYLAGLKPGHIGQSYQLHNREEQ